MDQPAQIATTPSERVWEIPCYVQAQDGTLIPDPMEVQRAMGEIGGILMRLGGVIGIASKREEVMPGTIVTTKLVVRWQSFTPVINEPATPPAPSEAEVAAAERNGHVPEAAAVAE